MTFASASSTKANWLISGSRTRMLFTCATTASSIEDEIQLAVPQPVGSSSKDEDRVGNHDGPEFLDQLAFAAIGG
jgi:hypothetical protein